MTVNGRTGLIASTILSASSDSQNSLEGIVTNSLQIGANCYVVENDGEYFLYPNDAQTPDGVNIVAATGGGNWLLRSIGSGINIDITQEIPGLILVEANLRNAVIERASVSPDFGNWGTTLASITPPGAGPGPWTLESTNPANSHADETITNNAGDTLKMLEAILEAGTANFSMLEFAGGGSARAWFDLLNGTVGTTSGSGYVDATIQQIQGTNRYRCRMLGDDLTTVARVWVTDADGLEPSALGSNIIVHQVLLKQVRCQTLSNLSVPTEPAENTTDNEQPVFLDWNATDPADSEWETDKGLVFSNGLIAPYHALEMDGLASNFGGAATAVAIYVYAKHLTNSGGEDHTVFSAVETGTRFIRFGFNDGDVFLARSGIGGPEVRVSETSAGLDTWALYAGYYANNELVVAVDDTLGTPAAFPFDESEIHPVAVNFGGEAYGGVPPNQSEAQILLWAVVPRPPENPIVFGDAEDLLIRGKIASIVAALGL